jgi:tetratricopeptide (TPR) repeat protein
MGENDEGSQSKGVPEPVQALQKWALALAGVLAAISQLWLAVQQQWQIAAFTLILLLVTVSVYFLFFRHWAPTDERTHRIARWSAIATLIGISLVLTVGLIAYSYLPRINGNGNTIAVSTFSGPALPPPYEKCRPSEALVRTLADVRDVFGHVDVFEEPYSIDPEGRFSKFWARAHGLLDGADAIVYGNFTLAKSSPGLSEADRIVLYPRIDAVPRVSTADKEPPLYAWSMQPRAEPIADLCGATSTGNDAAPFPDDARRLALALVAADLFASQNFERARDALSEAKDVRGGAKSCSDDATQAFCGGVLAFYLGSLDLRFGNVKEAEQEFLHAAQKLESSSPYVSLGELYMDLGRTDDAFASFDKAVETDPGSMAAIATRAAYERDYLRPRQAAIDLDQALNMQPKSFYDLSALSRALYQRGPGDSACGIALLAQAMNRSDFDRRDMLDTYVRYGVWLANAHRVDEAVQVFSQALNIDPYHIKANYSLGIALEKMGAAYKTEAAGYLHKAVYAAGYTDEDDLDRANAANELRQSATDAAERDALKQLALRFYKAAIDQNQKAAYAFWNRGRLYESTGEIQLADQDLHEAASLHSNDANLLLTYSQFLKRHGRATEAAGYEAAAKAVSAARIPKDEALEWQPSPICRYQNFDLR